MNNFEGVNRLSKGLSLEQELRNEAFRNNDFESFEPNGDNVDNTTFNTTAQAITGAGLNAEKHSYIDESFNVSVASSVSGDDDSNVNLDVLDVTTLDTPYNSDEYSSNTKVRLLYTTL